MKKHITEDYIKNFFQNYYKIHKRSPKSNDKTFPFSNKLVSKYFGTWCAALEASGLPLYKNKKVLVACKNGIPLRLAVVLQLILCLMLL